MNKIRSWYLAVLVAVAGMASALNAAQQDATTGATPKAAPAAKTAAPAAPKAAPAAPKAAPAAKKPAPEETGYAPLGTDLIVRINGPKIARSRAFALIRESRNFQKAEADMRGELAKSGMTMDALLNTDIFIFGDSDEFGADRPLGFTLIARNGGDFTAMVLKRVSAMGEGDEHAVLKKDPIGGREARLYKDDDDTIAAIALDKDLVAVLYNVEPIAVPVPRQPGELARRMAPEALISIAFKNDKGVNREIFEQLPPAMGPFLEGLVGVVADLLDGGDRLALNAELVYGTPERAQDVAAQLNGLVMVGMMSLADKKPAQAKVLQYFRISCRGRKVVVRFSCRNDRLARAFLK